ncbi:hypothetical protein YYC_00911 [Plasmodium yoelii 17X]|uniref:Uncharacterized protein n=3 Tax=Plasmodium yoelii TaxID=5861 RepID=A0AAF0B5Y8_PLAYO|nr:conserved Plasmodium protein, unknown function [Plasmodium yoelii]ETB62310.1 hypothetical protein YYC_00911 [Plasmodium yoelii 17X]WBY59326.1 hypothetical protein Py17XNL_001205163 [Plasmodium yoelii yoelii]CDU19471.1 conserved Plasmodium protein, unknown function [Plasmodium yoelii]VTZ80106.1 conserved Plasmodium protein, unknown function [Plasmodium yoelii]|eukprot:XP_022812670.1 conserved Plasmodium protein, unknown function [Plasmodium yoelii]
MALKQDYKNSIIEKMFTLNKISNSQYYENIINEKKKSEKLININNIKNDLLNQDLSLDICQKKKDYYLNTKSTNNIQNYFYFYDYRKCIYNLDGKIYMDKNPIQILNNNKERDSRLNEPIPIHNYNSFIYAYNI